MTDPLHTEAEAAIERLRDHLGEDAEGTLHNVSARDVALVLDLASRSHPSPRERTEAEIEAAAKAMCGPALVAGVEVDNGIWRDPNQRDYFMRLARTALSAADGVTT